MLTIKVFNSNKESAFVFQAEKAWFKLSDSDVGGPDYPIGYIDTGSLDFEPIGIKPSDSFYIINDSGHTVLSKKPNAMGAS